MSRSVAVLLGGISAEREVSLVSGRACARALGEKGYEVREIEVGADVAAFIEALAPAPDVIFNALHGRWGEDGCVQGLLELMRIPYTHSGVMASAIAMDKDMTKRIAETIGIRTPESRVVEIAALNSGDVLPRPYVVKPTHEGSSVGVHIVQEGTNEDWRESDILSFGDTVLVERYVPGRELTVTVMGDRALAVTELRPRQGFYDYAAKYTEGKTEHIVPADVSSEVAEAAMKAALGIHRALGCRGVTRSDFRYDGSEAGPEGLYFLEINTQPGMTEMSLVPEQAGYAGISFPELCAWIVEQAVCDGRST